MTGAGRKRALCCGGNDSERSAQPGRRCYRECLRPPSLSPQIWPEFPSLLSGQLGQGHTDAVGVRAGAEPCAKPSLKSLKSILKSHRVRLERTEP